MPLNNSCQDAQSGSLYFFTFPPWVARCSASILRDATVLEILGKALPFALGKNCVGRKLTLLFPSWQRSPVNSKKRTLMYAVLRIIQVAEVFETVGLVLRVVPPSLEKECLACFPKCGPLFRSCSQLPYPSCAGSPSF